MQQRFDLTFYFTIVISVNFKYHIEISQQKLDAKKGIADVSMPYWILQSDVNNKQDCEKPLHRLEA